MDTLPCVPEKKTEKYETSTINIITIIITVTVVCNTYLIHVELIDRLPIAFLLYQRAYQAFTASIVTPSGSNLTHQQAASLQSDWERTEAQASLLPRAVHWATLSN